MVREMTRDDDGWVLYGRVLPRMKTRRGRERRRIAECERGRIFGGDWGRWEISVQRLAGVWVKNE